MGVIGWALFVAGAVVCVGNAYLAILRYPIHRLRGGSKETYSPITGWPLIGIFAVWLGVVGIDGALWIIPTAVILTGIDLLCSHLFASVPLFNKKRNAANKSEQGNRV